MTAVTNETSGQSNLRMANTIELVLPWAPPKSITQTAIRFSRFCTAHGRKSYTLQWASLSPKLPLPMRISTPSNTWFLGSIRAHNANGISDRLSRFTQM